MKAFIENSIINNNYKATHLLQLLRLVQQQYHYISELAISIISESLKVPRTQVISVIEFYSFLHNEPQGEYELLISDSITDKMLGKDALMDYLAQKLNVAIGSVRADGRVSLNNTSCTGL
jgi:[NiFe] hydrogenase diaphorase moiety large subunit